MNVSTAWLLMLSASLAFWGMFVYVVVLGIGRV
jgi:hypothetical protein